MAHVRGAQRFRAEAAARLTAADARLHRACARAAAAGVPLRRIAGEVGVSHEAVRKWVAQVDPAELVDSVLVARARAERGERPGARGRRSKRSKR
jgi:hypothetical protein